MNESMTPMPFDPSTPRAGAGAVSGGSKAHKAAPLTSQSGLAKSPTDFQTLLDRMQQRVQGLEASEEHIEGPQELSAAVNHAEVSLQEALSLGNKLLEAFRAESLREGGENTGSGG